jgi:hypothetical protein
MSLRRLINHVLRRRHTLAERGRIKLTWPRSRFRGHF